MVIKIFQITDCHLDKKPNEKDIALKYLLSYIDNECVENKVVFLTGDIANCSERLAYERVAEYIGKHSNIKSCYAVAGNHDDVKIMKSCFYGTKIKIANEALIDGVRFLFLDTSQKPLGGTLDLGAGRITKKELYRLKKASRKK
ncbi:hypothetical protein AT251_23295 [Enterovibrio nigricans]|nr:hypothetical protein AT251_23295 [Enterovibrio nigricans]